MQGVVFGVADIVTHFAREIDEHAKAFTARTAVNEQKIVRTIVGKLVFAVAGFIGVVGNVVPAALVDAARHFAQTVHDGIRSHPVFPAAFLCGEKGHRPGGNGNVLHHTVGGQGSAKTEMLDHKRETSCWNYFSQTLRVCQCSPLCRLWRHLSPARGESFSVGEPLAGR